MKVLVVAPLINDLGGARTVARAALSEPPKARICKDEPFHRKEKFGEISSRELLRWGGRL